jgi:hypothetical protein
MAQKQPTYKVLGQITTASASIATATKALSASTVTITTASAHNIVAGMPLTIVDNSDLVYNVTNKALTASVATLTLSTTHRLTTGSSITVAGVDATFNGTYIITAITANTLSYTKNAANVTSASATGTVTGKDPFFNGTFTVTSASSNYFTYTYNSASTISASAMSGSVVYYPWVTSYTCPASTATVTSTLIITNRGATSAYYQIAVARDTRPQVQEIIVYNDLIAANDVIMMTLGLTLDPTVKYLLFAASDGDLSFNVFGMEYA